MISQQPEQPSLQVEQSVLHDARAVHDTASLRVREYMEPKQPIWVLAVVVPEPDSGSTTIPGAYISAETGQLENPTGSDAFTEKRGKWSAIAMGDPKLPLAKGVYSWLEPLATRKRVLVPEDYYSVFVHGGTILFRRRPSADGINEFESARLLFRDWAAFVGDAFAVAERGTDFLEAGKDIAPLTPLLSHKNLLLATIAFRELVATQQLPFDLAGQQLSAASSRFASLLCYLMVTAAPAGDARLRMTQEVTNVVAASHDIEKLHALALGAFAASLFCSQEETVSSSARAIGATAHQKVDELRLSPNAQLRWIFEQMGIISP